MRSIGRVTNDTLGASWSRWYFVTDVILSQYAALKHFEVQWALSHH